MATVRKRTWGDGKEAWVVSYTVDGKRHIETVHSLKAGEAHRREIEHQIDMGIHTAKGESILFRDATAEYLLDWARPGRKKGKNTLNSYRKTLELYVLPHLGSRRLSELGKMDFTTWIDDLNDKLKPSVVHSAYQRAFAVMGFGVDKRWIKRNILRDNPVTNLPKLQKRKDVPGDHVVQTVINACEQQVRSENLLTFLNRRVFVYLLALCGMRPGEAFGLQWENLDFARNEINISHSFNQYDGLKAPKSEAGKRSNTITPPLYAALEELALYWALHDRMCQPGWRSYRRKTVTTRIQDAWARRNDEPIDIPPRTGFVILSKAKQPMRTNACVWFWGGLMRKAGCLDADGKPLISPYDLRHFHISHRLANRELVVHVSKDVGHSQPSITFDVYGHVLPGDESAKKAVMDMGERLAPKQLPPPDLPDDNRQRKLTEDQVREVRARIANGDGLQRIGREMGVSLSTVYDIKTGRRWRWLA